MHYTAEDGNEFVICEMKTKHLLGAFHKKKRELKTLTHKQDLQGGKNKRLAVRITKVQNLLKALRFELDGRKHFEDLDYD